MTDQGHPHHHDLDTPEGLEAAAEAFRRDFNKIREQIASAVVGHDEVVTGVLTCLFAGGHALLEGVPGIGKTLLVRSLSQATTLSFGRVQFTPDLMPADITGTTIAVEVEDESDAAPSAAGRREFRFQPGPIFAQIILADEINRATPKTQAAMLEAMQEQSVTVQGTTHLLPNPFFVLATQNPLEQEGTYPLPEAQLDRFLFKLLVGYSTRKDLHEILARTTGAIAPAIQSVLSAPAIEAHRALVRRVASADHVTDYAVRMVLATQPSGQENEAGEPSGRYATPMVNQYVRVGASPRAAQALMLGGKVRALLDSRVTLAMDDIAAVALPALRHRIILNFEAEAEGVTCDRIVRNIVDTLPREVAAV